MNKLNPLRVTVLAVVAVCAFCWSNVPLRRIRIKSKSVIASTVNHSEYRYGLCDNKDEMRLMNTSVIYANDSYRSQLITRYVKVDKVPECTVILAKAPPEYFVYSTRLPMQLCYSRVTFIDYMKVNQTVMLEIAFFMEYEDPIDFHMFYYSVEVQEEEEN